MNTSDFPFASFNSMFSSANKHLCNVHLCRARRGVGIIGVALLGLVLSACGSRDGSESKPKKESSASSASAVSAAPSSSSPATQSTNPNPAAPNTSGPSLVRSPEVTVPQDVFAPTVEDVQRAFAEVLVQTVGTMPQSKERDQWYQKEAEKLQSIQIQQCAPAPVGTAAQCRIQIAGQQLSVKLLLTQSGWFIVK